MEGLVDFSDAYVRRVVDEELDNVLSQLPAVLIDGPKGVGKTATASQRHSTLYQLDDRAQREVIAADPNRIIGDAPPILIDEWHLHPDIWSTVKRAVDQDRSPGRFILTGSTPPSNTKLHSGAGRISTVRMRPLSLQERIVAPSTVSLLKLLEDPDCEITGETDFTLDGYVDEILAGGLPGLRALKPKTLSRELDAYLARLVEHDFPENGLRIKKPGAVTAWMRGYAAATATTTKWSKIQTAAEAAGSPTTSTTAMSYVELLNQLRILDSVPSWSHTNNHFKRLVGAEKHHLADPVFAARLLGLTRRHLLQGKASVSVPRDGTFLGALFESLTALSVRVAAQACDANVFHLRTRAGEHEVDFIVESDEGIVGIEVKLSTTVNDDSVKHLNWLKEKLGDDCINRVIITTGNTAYRRTDGVAVVPLALLGE